jgi:DNA-binding NarL/FixJ family response regulator
MQTILLADDHPVVLCGLERFLGAAGDFEIVASCRDGCTALPIIRDKEPDLALLDVDMPSLSGFDILAAVMSDALNTKVVLLSEAATHTDFAEALRNGAWDLISKTFTASEMLHHLRWVAAGYRWFASCCHDVASEAADVGRHDSKAATTLTPRERQIAALVASGMSNKEIAQRIEVSVGTVKIHLSNIFQKLNLNNRTSLAAVAFQEILRSAPGGPSNFG